MSDNSDKQYDIICAEILAPTLRKIALSYSVPVLKFYEQCMICLFLRIDLWPMMRGCIT